jgi:Zn-dependent peptidase ImmA (M78 family)/transcriptional regulator with XRE-family HTH domain
LPAPSGPTSTVRPAGTVQLDVSTTESQTIGRRIQQARERAGLTQTQLAAEIGIERSGLTKVEGGTRRVTALELAGIATALDERIEWFVAQAPAAIVSHRHQAEPGSRCPEIDRVTERFARSVEFVVERDKKWSWEPDGPLPRPQTVSQAEDSAHLVRQSLNLGAHEPVKDLADTFVELGALTFSINLGPDAADAGSVLLERGGVAVINAGRKSGRRRLAPAHEPGHHVFADEYTIDHGIGRTDDPQAWEHRLDRFARALLLPRGGIQADWNEAQKQDGGLRTTVVRMASDFMVDMATPARRLLELGLVDAEQADRVRRVRTEKAGILEQDLVIREELCPGSLPREYEKAVLRLYRQESVSAARALDLLLDTGGGGRPPRTHAPPEGGDLGVHLLTTMDDPEIMVLDTGPLRHFATSGWLGPLRHVIAPRTALVPDIVMQRAHNSCGSGRPGPPCAGPGMALCWTWNGCRPRTQHRRRDPRLRPFCVLRGAGETQPR